MLNNQTDVLLVTVNEYETDAVTAAFGRGADIPPLVSVEGHPYRDFGTVNGFRIMRVLSEMGSGGVGAMQQTVDQAIRHLNPSTVIAVGIAFGVDPRPKKQKLGDILVSKQIQMYELQRVTQTKDTIRRDLRGDKPHVDGDLLKCFREAWDASKAIEKPTVRFGLLLTGEKLVDSIDYRKQLLAIASDKVIGGEMEGGGLYVACHKHKVNWIVIKAICDWGDGNKNNPKKDEYQKFAARNAAEFVRFTIETVGLPKKKQSADLRVQVRHAFRPTASGDMLRREDLTAEDLRTGRAVKPPKVDEAFSALMDGKNVAVQGPPGSGKSAFAAWIDWMAETSGQPTTVIFGNEYQQSKTEDFFDSLSGTPKNTIVIIDDVHLIPSIIIRMRAFSWASEQRFLLLGRSPQLGKAMDDGELPRIDRLIEITQEDAANIAEELVKKYEKYFDRESADKLLRNSGNDLVLTKWLLERVCFGGLSSDMLPKQAAKKMLDRYATEADGELLRLLLTLAAFRWIELWCPERFLVHNLGFELKTLKKLRHLGEFECDERSRSAGGHFFSLMRHPLLCEIFLDVAPDLGVVFDQCVLSKTRMSLGLEDEDGRSLDLSSLVLGAALSGRIIPDVQNIQWLLGYGSHSTVYLGILKVAAKLLSTNATIERSDVVLELDERIHCLNVAFSLTGAVRRRDGGLAGKELLDTLQVKLKLPEFPKELFADKGRLLYEDAYIAYLNNDMARGIARFEESAAADEQWAEFKNSPKHKAKAAMSCNAAAACRIDRAVFAGSSADLLAPDCQALRTLLVELEKDLRTVGTVLESWKGGRGDRLFIEGVRVNMLLELAEAAAWLADGAQVNEFLGKLGKEESDNEDVKRRVGLVRGVLAYRTKEYGEVISELREQGERRLLSTNSRGEGNGKIGALLLLAYQNIGQLEEARKIRLWLESDRCPTDCANGLAKAWAARIHLADPT